MTIAAEIEETTPGRPAVTVAPLRDGDVGTVRAVVDRLGARSRLRRFGKTELRPSDLAYLATVGDGRSVLVARAGGRPVAVAHLVRDCDPSSAEAAVMVADEWQGVGIGTALAHRLARDAAAAGISRVHAFVGSDNRASHALMRRATSVVSSRFEGADVHVVGEIRERRGATRLPAPSRGCLALGAGERHRRRGLPPAGPRLPRGVPRRPGVRRPSRDAGVHAIETRTFAALDAPTRIGGGAVVAHADPS